MRAAGAALAAHASSSRSKTAKSLKQSLPSTPAVSSTNMRQRVRSIWRRNRWPSPLFSCAPSMMPGRSATVNDCASSYLDAADA